METGEPELKIVTNPFRGGSEPLHPEAPYPSVAAQRVADLLGQCPVHMETPLCAAPDLAEAAGISGLWIKDERGRMGLGSFKALGAAYVIARHAADKAAKPGRATLKGETYVTASAGNHGMSVAAGARLFGAKSIVYIAETVPEVFAVRLAAKGAEVRREGVDYAASMVAAQKAAAGEGMTLLSDSSWAGYTELPHILMEGYLQMAAEAVKRFPGVPTHIFLQAGVGGLAGAVAAYARTVWGKAPKIIVVEPEAAAALQASIEAGHSVVAAGPDSIMGRLDCKEPSLIALNGLARDADLFLTLSDAQVEAQLGALRDAGFATTASGGAGVAAVLDAQARAAVGLGPEARVLTFLSETPE